MWATPFGAMHGADKRHRDEDEAEHAMRHADGEHGVGADGGLRKLRNEHEQARDGTAGCHCDDRDAVRQARLLRVTVDRTFLAGCRALLEERLRPWRGLPGETLTESLLIVCPPFLPSEGSR